jgi:hypothetical protein
MLLLESLALIVAVAIVIKLIFIFVSPRGWLVFTEKIYSRSILLTIILFFLALAVLQLLLDNGMTIVEIFAVMLFLILISGMSFAVYSKEFLKFGKDILRDKAILKKAWFVILIWALLCLWVFYEVLIK